jgi:hypothetical protein
MYTKEQVDEMLSQVEQEFQKTLGDIAKNENTEEVVSEEEVTEEVSAQEESQELSKNEEESEDQEYGDEDYQTIDDLYASMSKSEKIAHYNSIKKAMATEFDETVKEEPVKKSESKEDSEVKTEIETVKAENQELKKSIDNMNDLINKLFSVKKAPAQKAITGLSVIAKSEDVAEEKEAADIAKMSKSEITSKLQKIDYSSLSKSDRTAINDFYLNNGSVEKIKHLIKE